MISRRLDLCHPVFIVARESEDVVTGSPRAVPVYIADHLVVNVEVKVALGSCGRVRAPARAEHVGLLRLDFGAFDIGGGNLWSVLVAFGVDLAIFHGDILDLEGLGAGFVGDGDLGELSDSHVDD